MFFLIDNLHYNQASIPAAMHLNPGNSVLGVTFTLVRTSGGVPTGIANNGKADIALRDIYYNDNDPDPFSWAIGSNIDVETVALH
jgi:hypothetical protein